MKIPKINDMTGDDGTTILQTVLDDHVAVLTSYNDLTDEYVTTVHLEPYGIVKMYTFPASDPDNDGLYMTHAFAMGVVLGAAVATGVIAA